MKPQAIWSLWPIPITGMPAALTPRRFGCEGEWSSNSTNSSGELNPSWGPL